jgi:hypothetical protein
MFVDQFVFEVEKERAFLQNINLLLSKFIVCTLVYVITRNVFMKLLNFEGNEKWTSERMEEQTGEKITNFI